MLGRAVRQSSWAESPWTLDKPNTISVPKERIPIKFNNNNNKRAKISFFCKQTRYSALT